MHKEKRNKKVHKTTWLYIHKNIFYKIVILMSLLIFIYFSQLRENTFSHLIRNLTIVREFFFS